MSAKLTITCDICTYELNIPDPTAVTMVFESLTNHFEHATYGASGVPEKGTFSTHVCLGCLKVLVNLAKEKNLFTEYGQ